MQTFNKAPEALPAMGFLPPIGECMAGTENPAKRLQRTAGTTSLPCLLEGMGSPMLTRAAVKNFGSPMPLRPPRWRSTPEVHRADLDLKEWANQDKKRQLKGLFREERARPGSSGSISRTASLGRLMTSKEASLTQKLEKSQA